MRRNRRYTAVCQMRLRHAGRSFARLDRTTAHGAENSRKIGGSFRRCELCRSSGGRIFKVKRRRGGSVPVGRSVGRLYQLCVRRRNKNARSSEPRRPNRKNACDALFSVEDCIRKLPLNYDYVRKLFKKETGVTPHEYLVNLRMKRARAIISGGVTNRYSKYSVSQIAEACGFAEPLYFSRVFKKYFGVSPSEYIK